jgi:hypothetical protein
LRVESGDFVGDHELDAIGVDRAVRGLLKSGLPARERDPIGPLLDLRGVIARSVKPEDSLSRIDALNKLLKQMIRRWPREKERAALNALFGLEKGYAGGNLTARRERAATHTGYGPTHFRKVIEPKLIDDFAAALWQDHLRYSPRTKYAPLPTEISGDTPSLGPGDYSEQEELVSRIWSEVYALRAEIIAGGRLKGDQSAWVELAAARGSILWRTARLLTYLEAYLQKYGDRVMQGETQWDADGLIRLAGWRGGVSDDEAHRLRLGLAQVGVDDRVGFLKRMGFGTSELG